MNKLHIAEQTELDSLRALCRYETHGGYAWAGVMSDGELLCVPCLRGNYREVFRATRDHETTGLALQGYACSDEHDGPAQHCAHCGEEIFASTVSNYREAKMILLLSDARGVYIPRDFASTIARDRVTGIDEDTYATLEAGPDHEWYWDAWADVCDKAEVTDTDGTIYTVYQDGDCWLVEKGATFNESPRETGIDAMFYMETDAS